MSKHITNIFILALLLMAAACNTKDDKQEIERVALGYIESTSIYDFDAAEQYASEQTKEVTLSHLRLLYRLVDSTSLANARKATFGVDRVKITSDSTALAIYHKEVASSAYTDTLNMVKENGAWKVDLVIVIPPIMQMITDSTMWNNNGQLPDKDEVRRQIMERRGK